MSLLSKEEELAMREELENFIQEKRSQLGQFNDPEASERFEKSLNRMRSQMEQLLELFRYQHENEED